MKLYFTRHGESVANVIQVISNRGLVHPLTDKGREQAHALAGTLREVGITAIYTSPLLRAVQTAEILSERLGVGFQPADALREYDCGILEGASGAETWAAFWALRADWQDGKRERRVEGGESFLDMEARFVPFVQALIADAAQQDGGVVLIGHGGLYMSMLPLVLTNIDAGFPDHHSFPNTGYVLAETRPQGLLCLEWCGMRVAS
jgi:broad specificity phosphatase PhoE